MLSCDLEADFEDLDAVMATPCFQFLLVELESDAVVVVGTQQHFEEESSLGAFFQVLRAVLELGLESGNYHALYGGDQLLGGLDGLPIPLDGHVTAE